MKNEVKYFALFREQVGCSSEAIEWQGGTATDLFAHVSSLHTGLIPQAAALVAVNDEMADWSLVLKDADEVLFFPPVAGG